MKISKPPMPVPTFGEIIVGQEICKACGTYNSSLFTDEERIVLLNELYDKVNKDEK